MHERRQERPDGGRQERGFPIDSHTLFVNSIGQGATRQAIRFFEILHYSHGSNELLEAASAIGVHEQIANPMRYAMAVDPGWFRKLDIAINNVSAATSAFNKNSDRHKDSGRAVFHFMSYQQGTGQLAHDVVGQFQNELPDVFHLGIVMVPTGDPVSMLQFRREAESHPLERLGIPLIVVDDTANRIRFFRQSMDHFEDSFLYGLAGLVADRNLFPNINRHAYHETLQTLAEETGIIGVGAATGVIDAVHGYHATEVSDKFIKFVARITADSLREDHRISSLPRKLTAELDVVVVQIPMATINDQWKNPAFFEAVHPKHSDEVQSGKVVIPNNVAYTYGQADTPTTRYNDPKPLTATHLYPAARSPGVDFLLEILSREAPAPSPTPAPVRA